MFSPSPSLISTPVRDPLPPQPIASNFDFDMAGNGRDFNCTWDRCGKVCSLCFCCCYCCYCS